MARYKIPILIVIFCFHQLCCLGGDYSFSKISIEHGLSNNQVNTIFKDSHGFIWLGTLSGIDRYDGVEIRPFSYRFSGSVESVYTITEDVYNTLWVGTTTGLFRFDQESDSFEELPIDTRDITVNALAVLPDSNLCVGTSRGLYLVNTSTLKWEKLALTGLSGDPYLNVSGILPDNHGNCWITTSNGLVRYSFPDKQGELFRCELMPQAGFNSFSSICSIGNKLYLGTTSVGIVEFDLSNKQFARGVETDNRLILNLVSDHKELIFAGTNGGGLKLINIRTREVESITAGENDPGSLSSNSIYSFYLDEKGRYWVGTYSGGLCYTKNLEGNFKLHPLTDDHPEVNKSIRSFYFAEDGSQYFGTRNGFLQLTENGRLKVFQASSGNEKGLRANIILSLFPYEDDILIGTYGGGLSRYSVADQKMVPFLEGDDFSFGNIYAFDKDSAGNLWISSFNGLYRYSPEDNKLLNLNTRNSALQSDQIFEITFDSRGRIWVGSMTGTHVYKLIEDRLEVLDLSVISNNTFKTNYIYEDHVGNIWLCTERGGLTMVDPELSQSTAFYEGNGLPDNSVCAIIERSPGEYWISSLKGLCLYSSQSGVFTKCYMSDGLPSAVFTPAATYLAPDGTLFFGNEKGLVYYQPDNADLTSFSTEITITDFYLSGRDVKPGENSLLDRPIENTKEIRLTDRMNSIGFRFVALNYINPSDNEYQYMLEGFDGDWKENGSNNSVFYHDLKSGSYLFKVRHSNEADGDLSNNAEIRIIIHTTFFNSRLFNVLLFLLAITGIYWLFRFEEKLPPKVRQVFGIRHKYEKYKGSKIPENHRDIIIKELKQYMEEEKPYLNAELKLADLASHIHHQKNEISQVLNQNLNQSFSDFVNRYRVEEVKRLMKDKAYEKFTLIAIANQSGFNSKTSFYRIFKNETGKTPADYLKELKNRKRIDS